MLSYDDLLTDSLRRDQTGLDLARIMADALRAVDPKACVAHHVAIDGDALLIDGSTIPLPAAGRVLVAGAGKAAAAMTEALVERLGSRIDDGIVVVKTMPSTSPNVGPVRLLCGSHPVPDARSVHAAEQVARLARAATAQDLLICPISGGASSLLCAPVPGISIEDLGTITTALLRSGVAIDEFNAVREQLDLLKGGGLARLAAPARVLTLVLSDVPGDDVSTVGSGPTTRWDSSIADATKVLGRLESIPPSVRKYLDAAAEHGAADDAVSASAPTHVSTHCVGSNATAVAAAIRSAQSMGYATIELESLRGEAREAGLALGRCASGLPPATLAIAGGETTVTVVGRGSGGRNQEVALAAVPVMFGLHSAILATLATDGEDGPTDAAGAVVRGDTLVRALQQGLDPLDALGRNDAHPFFGALGDLVRTGPTGTNVCDLAFCLTEKS